MANDSTTTVLTQTVALANGTQMPVLGYGTWFIQGEMATQSVKDAISVGYRLIDTAQAYANEKEVGRGVRESGVARDDIFVVSKVAAELKDYDSVRKSVEQSSKDLDVGPIDLMLVHSPQPWKLVNQSEDRFLEGNREAWKAMEDAVDAGLVRNIGVSNFEIGDLENILGMCRIAPSVNQLLCHAGHTPLDLINWCKEKNINIMSYSPLGHGSLLKNMLIIQIADKYNVSPAQLCIRYDLQLGTITIPKASSIERMQQNADVNFEITPDDMDELKKMVYLDGYDDADDFPCYGGKM